MQDALLSNEEFKRARYGQYGKIAVDVVSMEKLLLMMILPAA